MAGGVEDARSFRPRKPRTQPDHTEIYARLGEVKAMAEAAQRAAKGVSDEIIAQAVDKQRIVAGIADLKMMFQSLSTSLGEERQDEHGEWIGTGIIGRLGRMERRMYHRFRRDDRWVAIVIGFVTAAGIFGPVIWWLVSERLAHVLK